MRWKPLASIGLLSILVVSAAWSDEPATSTDPPAPSALRAPTGDDAQRAKQLEQKINAAIRADRWAEAATVAEELLALRERVQGAKPFEVVDASWRVRTYRLVAALPKEGRAEFLSVSGRNRQAESWNAERKYAAAQPLLEQALEINRRLLSDDHPFTARSYHRLAHNLNAQKQYAAAQPPYEKALALRRRLLTDDHPDTAQSYNNLAHNLWCEGKYAAAQPLFEKALEINRRLLTNDHPFIARSYNNLAHNLHGQSKYAAAQPLFEKALELRRRLLTDDHLDTAQSYHDLASNIEAQGNYAAAQPLFEKALELRRRLLTGDHPDAAISYDRLASNLDAQGRHAVAQPLYEKALEIRRRLLGDDHRATATSYNNVAHNLWCQGKYAAAQPLFEKALALRRRLLTDDHADTASSFDRLASNLDAQGKHAEAEPLFAKALEIRRRLLTDDHPDTALSYNNVAHNLNRQGKYAAAQPLFAKALEIRRRLLGDDDRATALSYNNVAHNLWCQGKYADAEPLYAKALELRRRLLTDDHPDTALSSNNLAVNLAAQGKYAAAQPLFEKALEIRRRLLKDEHPDTAHSFDNLARNLAALGKPREAVDQLERAARAYEASRLQAAFAGLDRATATSGTSGRLLFSALLARLDRGTEAWQQLEEQWGRGLLDELAARQDKRLTREERDRLRQLVSELERLDRLFEAPMRVSDQAERAKRLEELRLDRDRARIALGVMQTELVKKYGPLAGEVAPLAKIQSYLALDTALIAWVDFSPRNPNPSHPDGEHWGVVVRAQGEPVWVKLPGTGKDQHWTPADDALPDRVRNALRSQPRPDSADGRPLVERFYEQRLAPLAAALAARPDGLPSTRRLIVLPSKALAAIPVEALLRPADTWTVSYAPSATVLTYLRQQPRPDANAALLALGDPVFDEPPAAPTEPGPMPDHGLLLTVVVPGSNAAKNGQKRGDVLVEYNGTPLQQKSDLKVVPRPGDPVPIAVWREGRTARRAIDRGNLGAGIDPQPARVAMEAQRRFEQLLVTARAGDDAKFARLPGTRYEVAEIARLFENAKRPVHVLLDAEASEPEIARLASSGALGQFGFIHLATHGVIDERFPQRSAVILTQTGLPDPLAQVLTGEPVYDGRLVVREIQRDWELKAELVTLSACETARGQYAGGEGFVGFTQALLLSGARSVCLSLWKVDDMATALLMRRFYANLLGVGGGRPQPKAEALAEAKAWLRGLRRTEAEALAAALSEGEARGKGAPVRRAIVPQGGTEDHPYDHPYYWAAFVLIGDPD